MERSTPVRKPYTSTADLLTWSETPPADSPAPPSSASRSHQVYISHTPLSSPMFYTLFFLLGWWVIEKKMFFFGGGTRWNFSRRMGSARWCLGVRSPMKRSRA